MCMPVDQSDLQCPSQAALHKVYGSWLVILARFAFESFVVLPAVSCRCHRRTHSLLPDSTPQKVRYTTLHR